MCYFSFFSSLLFGVDTWLNCRPECCKCWLCQWRISSLMSSKNFSLPVIHFLPKKENILHNYTFLIIVIVFLSISDENLHNLPSAPVEDFLKHREYDPYRRWSHCCWFFFPSFFFLISSLSKAKELPLI